MTTPSRIERIIIGSALFSTALIYVILRSIPSLDPNWNLPIFHFYIVTYTSLTALVSGIYIFFLVSKGGIQPMFLALAFTIMAGVFFTHGIATPGVLISGPNVAVGWSARLSLTNGALLIVLALYDYPEKQLAFIVRNRLRIWLGTMLAFATYVGLIFGIPEPFDRLGRYAGTSLILAIITISLLGWATYRAWNLYQLHRTSLHRTLVIALPWLIFAQISQYNAPIWAASWWMYHLWMLGAYLLTMITMIHNYEQFEDFRATWYFLSLGVALGVPLTLLLGEATSQLTEREDLRWTLMRDFGIALLFLLSVLFAVVYRAQRIMNARTRDVEQEKQWRSEMHHLIAHDLKSPLASILLSLDTLIKRDEALNPNSRERLERIQTSARTMNQLIFDMLDVERLEAGSLQLERDAVDLSSLVESSISQLQNLAHSQEITLSANLPAKLPVVYADQRLIQRVLQNLLSNAIKFTPQNGHVQVGALAQDQLIHICVDDTGAGIPPEQRERIFEKFSQLKQVDQRQGHGLGLAFCKLAIEQHGGSIHVEDAPSGGSRFIVTLPLSETPITAVPSS